MSEDTQLIAPDDMVVQFGHGTKVHFVRWMVCTRSDRTQYLYASSCAVASRHNVHGMRPHHTLTIDDVNCAACRKDVERYKERMKNE
jgi:hypothetical protein